MTAILNHVNSEPFVTVKALYQ